MGRVIAVAVFCLAAARAQAGTLTFEGSFLSPPFAATTEGAQGIAFDEASGHLFLVNEAGAGSGVLEVTTAGAKIDEITISAGQASGLDVLPNGNLLAADGGTSPGPGSRGLHEFRKSDGSAVLAVDGGIQLDISSSTLDVKSAAYHPVRNTIFVCDDDTDRILEFRLDGTLRASFSTSDPNSGIDPNFQDPEGIAVNPATGRLLVANDLGVRGLRELTPDGALVAFYALGGPSGFQDPNAPIDPEGVAMDVSSGTVYVAFHENGAVGAYVLDSDSDGLHDGEDNCVLDPNPEQTDTDQDGEGDACDETPSADSDGDGVPDLVDGCDHSDLRPTVFIGACNSGVANDLLRDGCTVSDRVNHCARFAHRPNKLRSCTLQRLRQLRHHSTISSEESQSILLCLSP